ncbi:unnamed protein product [Urochloa humidicola]
MRQAAKDIGSQLPPLATTEQRAGGSASTVAGCFGCRPPPQPRYLHLQAGRRRRGRAGRTAPGRLADRVPVVRERYDDEVRRQPRRGDLAFLASSPAPSICPGARRAPL